MSNVRLIAIDPGALSGAYALFYDDGRVPVVDDIPVVDGQINAAHMARLIQAQMPRHAVIERVASMPKQGVASTFKFGMAVGIMHGVVLTLGTPLYLITPAEWKRAMKLNGTDKDAARALAIRLYPGVEGLSRKKDVGRADALLLGHYWCERERRS